MTTLFEMLNNDSIKAIAKNTVKVGDVYRIKMDERNGIKPKAGDISLEISILLYLVLIVKEMLMEE